MEKVTVIAPKIKQIKKVTAKESITNQEVVAPSSNDHNALDDALGTGFQRSNVRSNNAVTQGQIACPAARNASSYERKGRKR